MAVYGKKKKGKVSSFAVSEDEKTQRNANQHQSTYAHLRNLKTALSRTRSRTTLGGESREEVDERTENPSSMNDLTATVSRQKSSKSTHTTSEDLDKILPPLPPKSSSDERLLLSRPAPGDEYANTSTLAKASRTAIDNFGPIRSTSACDITETLSGPAAGGTTANSIPAPNATMADADDLRKKISTLMIEAAIQEEDTNRKAKLYAAYPSKISPFQRGKKVFMNATRAIKDRLSSHSDETPTKPTIYSPMKYNLSLSREASCNFESGEGDIRTRLNRRIAEGQNLANPKIQAMVGDGNIARKPLPVYESMKSRSQRSGSLEYFSDEDEVEPSPFPPIDERFNIDFNKPRHEKMLARDVFYPCVGTGNVADNQQLYLEESQATPRYSSMMSGLAQHPDPMDFSSSPVGFSTPRTRFEPWLAGEPNVKIDTMSRNPSLLNFSYVSKSDDEQSVAPSANSLSITDGSQSVKRKSAHSDLRSPVFPAFPASKKSKAVSRSLNEKLATGIATMKSEDDRIPLSVQDRNTVLGPAGRLASKRRGLKIFDRGKGQLREVKYDEKSTKVRSQGIINKRSSLPRASSMLFGGRDSGTGLKRLTSIDADNMSIDELQINDVAYQLLSKKRR